VDDNATIKPFASVTVTNTDQPLQLLTVTVTMDVAANGTFSTTSGPASQFQLTGTAAEITTALRDLVFVPTENQVAPEDSVTTVFTITLTGGVSTVTDNTTSVIATSVNDPPEVFGLGQSSTILDTDTVPPFLAVLITDADSPELTVTVAVVEGANGVFTQDSLDDSDFELVDAAVDADGDGEDDDALYEFVGTAAEATSALAQLVFDPTDNQVAPGESVTTNFIVTVKDGLDTFSDDSTTVTATSVNDTPIIGGTAMNQPVSDGGTARPFAAFTISDADPDQEVTLIVTQNHWYNGTFTEQSLEDAGFEALENDVDPDGPSYQFQFTGTAEEAEDAIRQLVFRPAANRVAPGDTMRSSFTVTIIEGDSGARFAASTAAAVFTRVSGGSVLITSVNDAPVLGGARANQTINDNQTVRPFAAFTITDADRPVQRLTVDVRLSHAGNGKFTLASLSASGFRDMGGGLYRYTGTAAQAQAAIRQLVYNPTDNQVAPGQSVRNYLRVYVSDGFVTSSSLTTSVIATSANDRPRGTSRAYQTQANQLLTVSAPSGLLVGASDADRDRLTVLLATPPASGALTLEPSGAFTYTPASGFSGRVTFKYQIADGRGGLSDLLTGTIDVFAAPAATSATLGDRSRWT
jgi:plastocyanin